MEQVYVIDDDKATNYLCKLILEDCGVSTNIVHSFYLVNEALIALQLAIEASMDFPDLILLDINLPGIDGWDFLERYRKFPIEKRKHSKIFMLSSSIYPEDEERSKHYPEVLEFIPKPLSQEIAEGILEKYFDGDVSKVFVH